jgi:cytochrome c oxidase subunit 5b
MENPIMVRSAGDEQYVGCTGHPADSHVVTWLGVSDSLYNILVVSKSRMLTRLLAFQGPPY